LCFLKEKYGVKILEDAAQSIGSEGKIGDRVQNPVLLEISVFSRSFPQRIWVPMETQVP